MSNSTIIDGNNPDNLNSNPSNEQETRKKFLTIATWAGRQQEMLAIFAVFDKQLREANDDAKKKDIGKVGAIAVYKLLGECFASLKQSGALIVPGVEQGELWVDGELIYKDK